MSTYCTEIQRLNEQQIDAMHRLLNAERDLTTYLLARSGTIADVQACAGNYRQLSMRVFGSVRGDRTEEAISSILARRTS